jgi:hypothetical protein
MWADGVLVTAPAFDDDLRLFQRVEDFTVEQLVSQATSLTPIWRIASAMPWPCETRTSTCRSFVTISSGLCLFLGISVLLDAKRHTSGRTTSSRADQADAASVELVLPRDYIRAPFDRFETE